MISQIGSYFYASSSSSGPNLSESTKKKLIALGVDVSSIKTEAQGQSILKAIESKKNEKEAMASKHVPHNPNSALQNAMTKMQDRVKALAEKVGISISADEKIEDSLAKIAAALSQIKVQGATEPQKITIVDKLQTELDSISSAYSSLKIEIKSEEKKLTGSLDILASYNKISLGLQ